MSNWPEGDVDIDRGGGSFHYYRTGGDKPPVVLAHGITDNGLCWTRLARVLESDFDVVMVDARGHGGSSRIEPGSIVDQVADLAAAIEALNLENPALIGHSMGAGNAAGVAARHSQLVSKVVLEDPPWQLREDTDNKSRLEGFRDWVDGMSRMPVDEIVKQGKRLNPAWSDEEFPAWAESKKQVDPNILEALSRERWQDLVPSIRCPALLIFAEPERGGICSAELAAQVSSMNPRFESREIAGAGHNIRREQFDQYVEAVSSFLMRG